VKYRDVYAEDKINVSASLLIHPESVLFWVKFRLPVPSCSELYFIHLLMCFLVVETMLRRLLYVLNGNNENSSKIDRAACRWEPSTTAIHILEDKYVEMDR